MPALVDLGGGGGTKKKQLLPAGPQSAPNIGGGYSRAAVSRAVAQRSAPQPLISQPRRSAPAPAPKPPPVVVSNNQGNYTRPKPPPPVNPGPISGGGGGPRGNNNNPRPAPRRAPVVTVPQERPIVQPPPAPTGGIPQGQQAPPVVNPPDLESYLAGDETYGSTVNQYGSDLTALQSQIQSQRGQNSTSFAQRLRDLQTAQQGDESNLMEDFASRGLAHSGSYADALSQLQAQYGQSTGNLQSEQSQAEADLVAQLTNFQAQQQQAIEQARADAIARRAAQYGL